MPCPFHGDGVRHARKASNDNLVQNNSFKNGGDGIFSGAYDAGVRYGADRNHYIGNDVSQAKHIGVEATFADYITVENNTITNVGRSGVWLGGSTNSIIRGNTITGSGWSEIENEGTQGMTIESNVISGSGQDGINLREIRVGMFLPSTNQFIARNTITNNHDCGIRAVDTDAINTTGNLLSGNGVVDVRLELDKENSLPGASLVNESQLLDATKECGGVDVVCSCRVLDGKPNECGATPGCTYFACSNHCEPAGTTACDSGCSSQCKGDCSDHDGHVDKCDDARCAYYFCSQSCRTPGTPEAVACSCAPHSGDPAGCAATTGCFYFSCSGGCYFTGTAPCLAGCKSQCSEGHIECPIAAQTNVTSNY